MNKEQSTVFYEFMRMLSNGAGIEMRTPVMRDNPELFKDYPGGYKPDCKVLFTVLTEILRDASGSATRLELLKDYREYGQEQAEKVKKLERLVEELKEYNSQLMNHNDWKFNLEDYGSRKKGLPSEVTNE